MSFIELKQVDTVKVLLEYYAIVHYL